MWAELAEDLRFYHRLRYPERSRTTLVGLVRVAVTSRGWWQLALFRAAHDLEQRVQRKGWSGPYRIASLALSVLELVMKIVTKDEILTTSEIAPGVYLSNRGGVILGCRHIGPGTLIHHNVTIGMNLYNREMPDIGRNVWIGHDSVIHGPVSIGDGTTILPGSVLTKSVPPRVVVRGNPARVVMRDYENSVLCSSLNDVPALVQAGT